MTGKDRTIRRNIYWLIVSVNIYTVQWFSEYLFIINVYLVNKKNVLLCRRYSPKIISKKRVSNNRFNQTKYSSKPYSD